MTEWILELFAVVVVLAVLRAVLGIVFKGVSDFYKASTGSPGPGSGPPRPPATPIQEALKKDPVCGTFVAPSTALRATVKGETFYFCSEECRKKFVD